MKLIKILFLILAAPVFAQTPTLCQDIILNSVKTESGVIISSYIYNEDGTPATAVLTKVSPQGEVLWRTETPGQPFVRGQDVYYFSDNYVYVVYATDNYGTENLKVRVKKIDPENGEVLWSSPQYTYDYDQYGEIIDYGDKVLFYYTVEDVGGGSVGGFELKSFNKSSGAVTHIHTLAPPNFHPYRVCINTDSQGNLIYAFPGGSTIVSEGNAGCLIRKISGLNFESIIWEKNFPYYTSIASLGKLNKLVVSKSDDIYCFSGYEYLDIFKLDGNSGDVIWGEEVFEYETPLSCYKITADKIYLSFAGNQSYYSSGSMLIKKLDAATGTADWYINLPVASTGLDYEGAKFFDLDCNGDLYTTGYYKGPENDIGAWISMKISGENGTEINHTEFANSTVSDTQSIGWLSYYYQDGPVFVGDLQYTESQAARTYIKTNDDLAITAQHYACDADSDGDSIVDFAETAGGSGYIDDVDSDNDGTPDYLDADDDGDTVPTIDEVPFGDSDSDGIADYLDTDDDEDSIPTITEAPMGDTDNDSMPDYLDNDDDNDTIPPVTELLFGDTDNDTIPNYLDSDDDNDTVPTVVEMYYGETDTDSDSIPNQLDNDDDGDGMPTAQEDYNGNGDPTDDFNDPQYPGLPDYLNANVALGVTQLSKTGIKVYPNPANDVVYVVLPDDIEPGHIVLFDMNGRRVATTADSANSIDISQVAKGSYLLKVICADTTYSTIILKK